VCISKGFRYVNNIQNAYYQKNMTKKLYFFVSKRVGFSMEGFTSFFMNLLPSTTNEHTTVLNTKIIEGNVAVQSGAVAVQHAKAAKEQVQVERDRNDMLFRKHDLEITTRQKDATAEDNIATAKAKAAREKQEEEMRVMREKIAGDVKVAEELKLLAQAKDRQQDAEWSKDKVMHKVATERTALLRKEQLDNLNTESKHEIDVAEATLKSKEQELAAKTKNMKRQVALDCQRDIDRMEAEKEMKLLLLKKKQIALDREEKERKLRHETELKKLKLEEDAVIEDLSLARQILIQTAIVQKVTSDPAVEFESNLEKLAVMGFTDRAKNIDLLIRHSNAIDLIAVVKELIGSK
jgi:hypothetical protein